MLGALAISQMQQLYIAINNRYECCFSMYGINLNSIMNSLKTVKILLFPLRLHSASSIQIPQSTNRYNSMLPSVYCHSATKINLHGVSEPALFRNHLKVRLFVWCLTTHQSK